MNGRKLGSTLKIALLNSQYNVVNYKILIKLNGALVQQERGCRPWQPLNMKTSPSDNNISTRAARGRLGRCEVWGIP
jgi:hypothetical protein